VARGPALTLAPQTTVAGALEAMRRHGRQALVVAQGQRPLGVVTERDIAAHACADGDDLDEVSLSAVMTPCPAPLRAGETVGAALRKMCAQRQWYLPLVDAEGLLLGALDVTDICLWLRDRMTIVSLEAALG
jgi:CBS domain-containing protein